MLVTHTASSLAQDLTKESLELSQQAYHLQALAEQRERPASSSCSRTSTRASLGAASDGSSNRLAAPTTSYYVTAYAREVATAPASLASLSPMVHMSKRHDHKDDSGEQMQADAALAAKYRLQHKVRRVRAWLRPSSPSLAHSSSLAVAS